jgi:hypothetical protein
MHGRYRMLVAGIVLAGVLFAAFASAATAKAAPDQSTWVPVDEVDFNPCTGDPMHCTGQLHLLTHVTDAGNGVLRIGDEMDDHLTGVDLVTAASSIGSSTYHDEFVANVFPASRAITADDRMISQGSGPNLNARIVIHQTYNAAGELTANTFTITSSCAG